MSDLLYPLPEDDAAGLPPLRLQCPGLEVWIAYASTPAGEELLLASTPASGSPSQAACLTDDGGGYDGGDAPRNASSLPFSRCRT